MELANYVCKRIRDINGNVTDLKPLYKASRAVVPRGDFELVKGDVSISIPLASFDGTNWTVIEDTAAKTADDAKKADDQTRRQKLKDMLATINADLDAAGNVNQLKAVVKGFAKDLIKFIIKD